VGQEHADVLGTFTFAAHVGRQKFVALK